MTSFASSDEVSPGLVQAGTKCGDEMVCAKSLDTEFFSECCPVALQQSTVRAS